MIEKYFNLAMVENLNFYEKWRFTVDKLDLWRSFAYKKMSVVLAIKIHPDWLISELYLLQIKVNDICAGNSTVSFSFETQYR